MAIATVYPASYNAGSYVNVNNLAADDGVYASIVNPTYVLWKYLYVLFNAFTDAQIPPGSTINSVTVRTEFYHSSAAGEISVSIGARYNGSDIGSTAAQNNTYPLSDTVLDCTTVAGEIWNETMLKDGLAGGYVGIYRANYLKNNTVYFDYIALIVDYTESAGPIEGSSSQGVVVSVEGQGAKISAGSSSQGVVVSVEGQGVKISAGSSSQGVVVSEEGQGVKISAGSSSANIIISSKGSGQTISIEPIEGSSVQKVIISAKGEGLLIKFGSSSAEVIISAKGEGLLIKFGSSSAEVIISAEEGQGVKISAGSSSANIIISSKGSGQTISIEPIEGSSVQEVIISAKGEGLLIKFGSSSAEVIISAEEGQGVKISAGSSNSTVIISGDNKGLKIIQNGSSSVVQINVASSQSTLKQGRADTRIIISTEGYAHFVGATMIQGFLSVTQRSRSIVTTYRTRNIRLARVRVNSEAINVTYKQNKATVIERDTKAEVKN